MTKAISVVCIDKKIRHHVKTFQCPVKAFLKFFIYTSLNYYGDENYYGNK